MDPRQRKGEGNREQNKGKTRTGTEGTSTASPRGYPRLPHAGNPAAPCAGPPRRPRHRPLGRYRRLVLEGAFSGERPSGSVSGWHGALAGRACLPPLPVPAYSPHPSRDMTPSTAPHWAEAWAPASVGNISVGFDLLGHALSVAGDRVRVTRRPGASSPVSVDQITGLVPDLPTDPAENTAGAALLALHRAITPPFGFGVEIRKGIPLGSGMGGSAASAVAALVAANALLEAPLPREALYPFALAGEAVASGTAHGDNVGPQLLGGVVAAFPDRLERLPVPWPLHCALVHPHQVLETRRSRAVLEAPFALHPITAQLRDLAGFVLALERGDLALLRASFRDHLVEPRRAPLIPGFEAARARALEAGALGAGISGGGPSLFGWFMTPEEASAGVSAMVDAFQQAGIGADAWVAPVEGPAARIEATG
jgi:homoserine kinase